MRDTRGIADVHSAYRWREVLSMAQGRLVSEVRRGEGAFCPRERGCSNPYLAPTVFSPPACS